MCACVLFSVDSLPLWQCSLPAVLMLSEWKQLHRHSADLCLLHADWCGDRLHNAHARHGGPSEEGHYQALLNLFDEGLLWG